MAGKKIDNRTKIIVKRTSQGGKNPKTSSMNKSKKASFKTYRGQGR